METTHTFLPWIIAAGAAFVVGIIGGLATDVGPWYRSLQLPPWNPPDWIFGPAWTVIYILCIVSAVKTWGLATGSHAVLFIILWCINCILNILWSVFFFKFRRPDWAAVESVILLISIVSLVWITGTICTEDNPWPTLMLAPYLFWVSFATVLTFRIVQDNKPFS